MKNTLSIIMLLFVVMMGAQAQTEDLGFQGIEVRLGYDVGGTMPLGMPATIRSLNSYTPQPNFQVGASSEYRLTERWGMSVGLNIDRKGMRTDADVKSYHMNMVRGGEALEGYFTGSVVSKCSTLSLSIPVQATFSIVPSLTLRLGPYVSMNICKSFTGWAYDGYIRRNAPTGERIELGHNETERGEYDFSDDVRPFAWGLDLGADYMIKNGWGVYADLQWGMSGNFKSSFTTISQTMYPIYGTIGVVKKL